MTSEPSDRFTRLSKVFIFCTIAMLLGGIARVAQLQVAPGSELESVLGTRTTTRMELHGRGSITDRRGRLVAFTEIGYRVYVDAHLVWKEGLESTEHAMGYTDAFERLALQLKEACGEPEFNGDPRTTINVDEVYSRLTRTLRINDAGELESTSRYVVLVEDASESLVDALASSGIRGVVIQKNPLRRYPYGDLGVQFIGKVGPGKAHKQTGRTGIEEARHEQLEPDHGTLEYVRNRRGSPMFVTEQGYIPGTDGHDIELTIDMELQREAEKLLTQAVNAHEAVGGWLIAIDPRTGDILAAADVLRNSVGVDRGGWPTPALDHLRDQGAALGRNRIWTDPFEPGSTFKPFFWAWATENGKASPDEVLPTPGGGPMTSGVRFQDGRRSRRIKDAWGYEKSTWSNALVKSLNTAMAMVAQRTTATEMQAMIEDFGFKSDSGISMPGEAASITTNPKKWDMLYTHLTVSFGQEIAITPIQLARAFCVFARDDGRLPLLRLTRSARSDTYSTPAFPVLSTDTVLTSRTYLREVMTGGTGRKAQSEKYSIFGKSGTPQMPNVMKQKGAGGYYDDRYNPNFLGAAPMKTPRIVVACGLQDPLKGSGANTDHNNHGYGGGYSAGRVVRDMIDFSLQYMGIEEDLPTRDFALGE